ncbi:MAG: zinc ABC transporter substrate-binding protein [Anaerolineales bacterium]|nr:zinc ABC transporter substrate-binding protein [Anaerolineales bacterium]
MKRNLSIPFFILLSVLVFSLGLLSCTTTAPETVPEVDSQLGETHPSTGSTGAFLSHLEDLSPVDLAEGDLLTVVATTTILADVAANIGGETVDLIGLFPLGSDPHTYEPTPADYQIMVQADVILINGVGLEEFLNPTLEQVSPDTPIISVSENIDLLSFGETGDAHGHDAGYDPHVWFDPENVRLWVDTIVQVFSTLDPDHAADYQANGTAYNWQLDELDQWIFKQTDLIPQENRELVTDHTAFSYFAARYNFVMIGAVIPAYSTSAEPSAQELAALEDTIKELEVKALYVGTSANPTLAEQAARDTGVQLLPLYTGSLSDGSGPAATYLELMRYNVNSIVNGLSGSDR